MLTVDAQNRQLPQSVQRSIPAGITEFVEALGQRSFWPALNGQLLQGAQLSAPVGIGHSNALGQRVWRSGLSNLDGYGIAEP